MVYTPYVARCWATTKTCLRVERGEGGARGQRKNARTAQCQCWSFKLPDAAVVADRLSLRLNTAAIAPIKILRLLNQCTTTKIPSVGKKSAAWQARNAIIRGRYICYPSPGYVAQPAAKVPHVDSWGNLSTRIDGCLYLISDRTP